MTKDKKPKNVFKEGAISSEFIGQSIAKHQSKTTIGAHNIFLGQVRADKVGDKIISAIEYTAYETMANEKFHEIREAAFELIFVFFGMLSPPILIGFGIMKNEIILKTGKLSINL